MNKAFFNAQSIQGLAASKPQIICLSRLVKLLEYIFGKVRGDKDFPAHFAGKGKTLGKNRRVTNIELL